MIAWDVELSKLISMIMMGAVLTLIFVKFYKVEKVNRVFFLGFIIISLIDFFCYFYFRLTKISTDKFFVVGISVTFFIYLFYYYQLLYLPFLKKIQLFLIVLFTANIAVRLCIEANLINNFSFNIFYVDIILLTFSIILFLYQTFNSDKIFEIKNYLPFWVSVGSLIFYIGIIPISYFRATVSQDIYFFFLFLLNVINNGAIVFGIVANKEALVKSRKI